ncbi:MAG: GTPase ObgE [Lentisphaeria bacterium]|nr:GTPase ObgE [Lentisphaeria bacterium]
MFVDKANISVTGGHGGHGCCSFHREKFIPLGGPDGGDGGPGGDVILVADKNEQSLVTLMYNRHYEGKNGVHGRGSNMHGKRGEDTYIQVPVGTVVTNAETGEFIADISELGMQVIVAKGGKGGRGNTRFATKQIRAPHERELGEPGEMVNLHLELKTIADVGLVGFPNAGKSTLLSKLSAARPKIAPYPFTTQHSIVGIIEYPDFSRVTVADIPGLIEGASNNVGLGHEFLKHIERTSVLLYVLDMAGTDGRTPWEDFRNLQNELELYMKGLSKRPALVVANKMDVEISQENLELLREELSSEVLDIIPISANENNLGDLKEIIQKKVAENRTKKVVY